MGERVFADDQQIFEHGTNHPPRRAVQENKSKEILDLYGLSVEVQDVLKRSYFGNNWDSFFSRFCQLAQEKKYSVDKLSPADAMKLLLLMGNTNRS